MKESKKYIIMLITISTILGGIGQFMFKYAFKDNSLALTIGAGLGIYAISTAIYFYVLSRVHLSWAYGLNGISYVVAVVLASTVLAEYVSPLRWLGVMIIVIGVVFVSMS